MESIAFDVYSGKNGVIGCFGSVCVKMVVVVEFFV